MLHENKNDIGYFLKFKDILRCPYRWGTPECGEWCRIDDERLEKLAISRGWKRPVAAPGKEKTNGEEES